MTTVAAGDGRPTHYACRTMLNNETDTCSIPKLGIQELDQLIVEKAIGHLLAESTLLDTASKMQDFTAAVKDFNTAKYVSVFLNRDVTSAMDALNTVIGKIVVGSDTVEVKYVDQNPEGTS